MAYFDNKQVDIIRALAHKVSEIAASKKNELIIKRWRDTNELRKVDRAPVWCLPDGNDAWYQLLPNSDLQSTDPYLRQMEEYFKRLIIKDEIGDDTPFLSYYPVRMSLKAEPENDFGVELAHTDTGQDGGAWKYDPPIKCEADLDKLVMPKYSVCKKDYEQEYEMASEVLSGIMPVPRVLWGPFGKKITTAVADLYGLEEMMVDMMLEPELMHRLMEYLRDARLAAIDAAENSGLLIPNIEGPMTCSDYVGDESAQISCLNMWELFDSQEFDQVSPAMWEEFLLEYQRPIMARFGLVSYGCCEDLTNKISGVMSIPNLRVFNSSAWTNLDMVIDAVGEDKVIMWRQKASDVVFAENAEDLRPHLEQGLSKLKGLHNTVVLRELQTLNGNIDRLHKWARIAIETAEKYS